MEQQRRASEIRHRRETLIQLMLPMVLLVLLLIAALVLVAVLPRGLQVGLVADLMFAVLILCPVAICLLPITLVVVAAVGMNAAHSAAARPLRKVEDASGMVVERAQAIANRVNQTTIDVSGRLGFLYQWLGVFEQSSDTEKDDQT